MDVMLLCNGFKYELCRFNRNWDMDNSLEKIKWRQNDVITHLIFIKFKHISTKGISIAYLISFWLFIRELRYKVGKLTENYEEKIGITSLWPWLLTQGNQFQWGLSQCGKQPFSENCVQIGSSFRLEFCSQENIRHTHRQTAVKI